MSWRNYDRKMPSSSKKLDTTWSYKSSEHAHRYNHTIDYDITTQYKTYSIEYFLSHKNYFNDQINSCLQDKEEQLDEGEKSITVDECLIDIIKGTKNYKTYKIV